MNMKLLGAAVAAALLGLSTASFSQPSGQDTPREAAAAKEGPGSAISGGATSGSPTGSSTRSSQDSPASSTGSTSAATNCDTLSGAAKTRCQREGASSGSSVPATNQPEQSGPGATDKTDPRNPNAPGAGTSSAGSN